MNILSAKVPTLINSSSGKIYVMYILQSLKMEKNLKRIRTLTKEEVNELFKKFL